MDNDPDEAITEDHVAATLQRLVADRYGDGLLMSHAVLLIEGIDLRDGDETVRTIIFTPSRQSPRMTLGMLEAHAAVARQHAIDLWADDTDTLEDDDPPES